MAMSNLRYIPDSEGNCTTREARLEELVNARAIAHDKLQKDAADYAFRTCYKCNAAHAHLMQDDGFLFCCFACGHWYYGGLDISEQEEELNHA